MLDFVAHPFRHNFEALLDNEFLKFDRTFALEVLADFTRIYFICFRCSDKARREPLESAV